MKLCSKCEIEKPESEFYKDSGRRCKACHKHDCTKRQQQDPEKNRQRAKRWYWATEDNRQKSCRSSNERYHKNKIERNFKAFRRAVKKLYKLEYEDYERMLSKQNGLCAICKKTSKRRLDVDHNHNCCPQTPTCGQCTRGLVCSNCNTAIGLLKEDPSLFVRAVSYLESFNNL